ncbi:MAG: DUF3108 domain-containing protein [Calditrichaeota bacterium]|nr:DUF3108 domain-containing protein [Candidatus Cloacimonadota bacterium]MCA9785868.1 DUF3108 domain-containing protein [Candidatus Cloacimonadota bacterium]MCB1047065.1 DUF3108 domain-containing protein [Calditrichota bacterium]MCB9474789.1 DUF3108 domain-containing protein [Candidatus Delongbacteria bacterium]
MRALLFLWILLLAAPRGQAGVPFGSGEVIQFRIGWGLIHAGTSWLRVKDTLSVRGRLCWELESEALSNDVISALYPVRDRVTSLMDVRDLTSRGLSKNLREGRYKKDRRFEIDPEAGQIRKIKAGEPVRVETLAHHVQDVLSAFYWLRTRPLEVGKVEYVSTVDELKNYSLAIKVLAREKVKVKAGEFDCFKVQPVLVGDGLFKSEGEVFIWLTADERRIPVQMKSKIFIGSISAQMESYTAPLPADLPLDPAEAERVHQLARRHLRH